MEFTISTKRGQDLIDITSYIKNAVRESGVKEGLAVVFVPHTTAGAVSYTHLDVYKRQFCNRILPYREKGSGLR